MIQPVTFSRIYKVFAKIRIPAISAFLAFTVTIGIFPTLFILIESQEKCSSNQRFYNELFVPFLFLIFNIFDFTGRLCAGGYTPLFNSHNIWIPAVARFVFFPLILLCKLTSSQLPVLFESDFFPIFFTMLFAFSNGYIGTLAMMFGPSLADGADATLAGTIMICSLTVGLLSGSCVSFLTLFISQGSLS